VYALEELFKGLSNTLHKDGLIHKDEFALALFKTQNQSSLFAEKVFELFDTKKNDVIEFGEFVRALDVFHPKAPLDEKAQFAFRIYDLDNTGWIEPGEIKRFLGALLKDNPAIDLDDAQIQAVIEQTFKEADLAGDGHISPEEWQTLVKNNPHLINYMTLPVLKELTKKYPSFAFNEKRVY
jgi:serine/threonine-protein phosphatase 2B regulatory subunit